MDYRARSVHYLLHFTGDKLDFDDEWTARGNLLALGSGRRLREILLGACQTADVVDGQIASASPSTPAAFPTPRLLTLEMAARSTWAEWHRRPM